MRIAVDTNALHTGQAGIARHVRGLLTGLSRVAPKLDFFPFAWEVDNFGYKQPARAFKTACRELIWGKFFAPVRLRKEKAGLYHATGSHFVAVPKEIPCVVTLHDLAMFRYPERFRRWQRSADARRARTLHSVEQVICVSRFTVEEAISLIGLPASKMEVVYNGCDFHPDEGVPAEQAPAFEVPNEFFLFVGSLEPGKNLSLLKESYRLAAEAKKPLAPLLIVGARWAGVAGEGAPPPGWQYLGRQPDAVLVWLYRRALSLVFPSKYEGFGFPIAEAMNLGCPVICSPVASLPEVGGQAALWSKLSPPDYFQAMLQLQSSSALREDLVSKGREQALKFSWTTCGAETAALYRRTL